MQVTRQALLGVSGTMAASAPWPPDWRTPQHERDNLNGMSQSYEHGIMKAGVSWNVSLLRTWHVTARARNADGLNAPLQLTAAAESYDRRPSYFLTLGCTETVRSIAGKHGFFAARTHTARIVNAAQLRPEMRRPADACRKPSAELRHTEDPA